MALNLALLAPSKGRVLTGSRERVLALRSPVGRPAIELTRRERSHCAKAVWARLCTAGAVGVVAAAARRKCSRIQQRASRDKASFDPIENYNDLKQDWLGSWGFLSSEEFAVRMGGIFVVGLIPSLVLVTEIFSPFAEDGSVLINNVAADLFFGSFVSFLIVFGIMLRLSYLWNNGNKQLRQRSYATEERATATGGYNTKLIKKSKKTAQRDNLLAEYETEPALARMRVYLAGSILLAIVSFGCGTFIEGDLKLATEQVETKMPPLKRELDDIYDSAGSRW